MEEIRNLQDNGNNNGSESDSATNNDTNAAKSGTVKPPPRDHAAAAPLEQEDDTPDIVESIETVLSNGGKSVMPIQRNEEFSTKAEEERDEYDKVGGNTRTLSRERLDMIEAKERQERLEELQREQQEQTGTRSKRREQ